MAQPSASLATLRPDLAASFEEFSLDADRAGLIGMQVLPAVEVAKKSGRFGIIPIEQLLQSPDTKRAPGSGYARGGFKFETSTFACEEHGWEEPIDDAEAAMYSEYFDHEQISAARARDFVLRNMEKRIAALIFNTTTWTGSSLTTAPTNEWDDAANAVPITDIKNASAKVWDGCGLWPDTLIISHKVFNNLRVCAQVLDAVKSAGAGDRALQTDINKQLLAQVFDLRKILVGGGAKNTATEGSLTLAEIWSGEYAMICKTADSKDFREPCVGRMFHWGEDGSNIGGTIESYRDETVRGDIVRVRHDVDEKVLYAKAAHLLTNITT